MTTKKTGRPSLPDGATRYKFAIALAPQDVELLETLTEKRYSPSLAETVRQAIREMAAREGIERRK